MGVAIVDYRTASGLTFTNDTVLDLWSMDDDHWSVLIPSNGVYVVRFQIDLGGIVFADPAVTGVGYAQIALWVLDDGDPEPTDIADAAAVLNTFRVTANNLNMFGGWIFDLTQSWTAGDRDIYIGLYINDSADLEGESIEVIVPHGYINSRNQFDSQIKW